MTYIYKTLGLIAALSMFFVGYALAPHGWAAAFAIWDLYLIIFICMTLDFRDFHRRQHINKIAKLAKYYGSLPDIKEIKEKAKLIDEMKVARNRFLIEQNLDKLNEKPKQKRKRVASHKPRHRKRIRRNNHR